MSELFRSERRGGVELLLLDRPPSNSLNLELLRGFKARVEAAESDPGVRAVVVASALPKYFSSGLDLEEMLGLPHQERAGIFRAMVELHRALAGCPKPTVAALSGSALLGGFIVAMACDFRLLGLGAKVSLNEIRLGLSPTTALIQLLSRLACSQSAVREMVLAGKLLLSEEALAAGIVDAVHPPENVEAEALRLAERLGRQAPRAYASVKRSYRRALLGDEEALWARSMEEFSEIFEGAEAQLGMAAYRDKKKAGWATQ